MRWTNRALADLDAIGAYIEADDPAAARRWIDLLIKAAERAASLPMAGRRVPEARRDEVREVFVRTYRVVYRVGRSHIDVLTVFEGHRRFPRGALRAGR